MNVSDSLDLRILDAVWSLRVERDSVSPWGLSCLIHRVISLTGNPLRVGSTYRVISGPVDSEDGGSYHIQCSAMFRVHEFADHPVL